MPKVRAPEECTVGTTQQGGSSIHRCTGSTGPPVGVDRSGLPNRDPYSIKSACGVGMSICSFIGAGPTSAIIECTVMGRSVY